MIELPTIKHEAWKYTNPKVILNTEYTLAPSVDHYDVSSSFKIPNIYYLIIVNGFLKLSLSRLPREIKVSQGEKSLNIANGNAVGFVGLNESLMLENIFIHVPADTVIIEPLQIIHIALSTESEQMIQSRVSIVLENNAKLQVIDTYFSGNHHEIWHNHVSEIKLHANAYLHYYALQQGNEFVKKTSFIQVEQAAHSRFNSLTLDVGGKFIRNELITSLNGEQANCTLNGLYVGDAAQHIDNHTAIIHAHANTQSHQYYKGILNGKSHGVFNGRVLVQPNAQKIEAVQKNANLLLSKDAEIDTKPELEIYADDVKCAHGATVGQLNDDALFYLTTRGIDHDTASSLLTYGFANELVEHIAHNELRHFFQSALSKKLEVSHDISC